MTPVQIQPRPTHPAPAHLTPADTVDTAPRVCDDMTVEVALSVMAGARTGHLLVCDDDGLCTGLVTRAQLTTVRESATYTDRLQLRDLSGDGEPLTPATPLTPGRAVRPRVVTSSGAGGQDDTPGALTPALVLA
ncbi:CBS domain-containing protein [Streptomyces sp. R44]|uniref:CBS domain-containing protein n=1 Tax=Streptomyces sp. R44 TaxID=3238633 RepID=A0AB39T1F7_9ACTN